MSRSLEPMLSRWPELYPLTETDEPDNDPTGEVERIREEVLAPILESGDIAVTFVESREAYKTWKEPRSGEATDLEAVLDREDRLGDSLSDIMEDHRDELGERVVRAIGEATKLQAIVRRSVLPHRETWPEGWLRIGRLMTNSELCLATILEYLATGEGTGERRNPRLMGVPVCPERILRRRRVRPGLHPAGGHPGVALSLLRARAYEKSKARHEPGLFHGHGEASHERTHDAGGCRNPPTTKPSYRRNPENLESYRRPVQQHRRLRMFLKTLPLKAVKITAVSLATWLILIAGCTSEQPPQTTQPDQNQEYLLQEIEELNQEITSLREELHDLRNEEPNVRPERTPMPTEADNRATPPSSSTSHHVATTYAPAIPRSKTLFCRPSAPRGAKASPTMNSSGFRSSATGDSMMK